MVFQVTQLDIIRRIDRLLLPDRVGINAERDLSLQVGVIFSADVIIIAEIERAVDLAV